MSDTAIGVIGMIVVLAPLLGFAFRTLGRIQSDCYDDMADDS